MNDYSDLLDFMLYQLYVTSEPTLSRTTIIRDVEPFKPGLPVAVVNAAIDYLQNLRLIENVSREDARSRLYRLTLEGYIAVEKAEIKFKPMASKLKAERRERKWKKWKIILAACNSVIVVTIAMLGVYAQFEANRLAKKEDRQAYVRIIQAANDSIGVIKQ